MELNTMKNILDSYFNTQEHDDFVKNGMLRSNSDIIEKVYTATFSSGEVIEKLKKKKAHDCLLFTHHPFSCSETGVPSRDFNEEEEKFLKENRISHYSVHLPFDNINPYSPGISLARKLGVIPYKKFFTEKQSTMGLIGTSEIRDVNDLLRICERAVGHKCNLYKYGKNFMTDGKLAIIAGGAEGTHIYEMLMKEDVNVLVTGVGSKNLDWFFPSHAAAAENNINIISAGHYSTEKFGVMYMCDFFRDRGLESEFIDETPSLDDL